MPKSFFRSTVLFLASCLFFVAPIRAEGPANSEQGRELSHAGEVTVRGRSEPEHRATNGGWEPPVGGPYLEWYGGARHHDKAQEISFCKRCGDPNEVFHYVLCERCKELAWPHSARKQAYPPRDPPDR
jgi:hypothetical protein